MSHKKQTPRAERRQFLKGAAALGAGYWVAGGVSRAQENGANDRIRFACIGIGGKGSSDSGDAARHGDVVAICDTDKTRLKGAQNRFPEAKTYTNYREMFKDMGSEFDAVTVSTPDHNHAAATMLALKDGKHAFTQKPLTHSIYEARMLGTVARDNKRATQMGNQGTSNSNLRKSAAIIQSGALGKVTEVHVWTNRPVWPQGGDRPKEQNVPEFLDWENWIGPAPMRPYGPGYHPFSWRGWWDFGTGALGDMACHTFNMPFMALNLRDPISVEAETSGHNKESYPKWSVITFQFPATDKRDAVKVVWYDGGKRPSPELFDGGGVSKTGSLIIGEKGKLHSEGDYGGGYKMIGVEEPKVEFVNSPGHFTEFAEAIKGGPEPVSNFPDYAGPLSETILLGNLAVAAAPEGKPQKVEWDAENMQVTNDNFEGVTKDELMKIVKHEYREGWTL